MKLSQVQDRQVTIVYLDNKYYLQITKQMKMFSMTLWGTKVEVMFIDHRCLEELCLCQLNSQQPPSKEKHEERWKLEDLNRKKI